MDLEKDCLFSDPSDKKLFEKSMIYLTNVFFDAYPQTSIDVICELAQNHLSLFKTIIDTHNEKYNDNSDESSNESSTESPTLTDKNMNIIDLQFPNIKNFPRNSKSEIKLRPSNPKRSPSKFSKDSYEYKKFINIYCQKLRDKNIDPKERSRKACDKWNSMTTEQVLKYLQKHNNQDE